MTSEPTQSIRPQPMISVTDVEQSSQWYQRVLGATSGHGGPEYERLLAGGTLILQLHHAGTDHHHGTISDPGVPLGNGVAVWFEAADFAGAVERVRESDARIETDVRLNPNAGHHEIWLRDPDGYLVVLAEAEG